jgi:hypothetical protein
MDFGVSDILKVKMFQSCSVDQSYFYDRFLLTYFRNYNLPKWHLPRKEWILDSGGYTIGMMGKDYKDMPQYEKYWTCEAYANFINIWKANIALTMDYAVKKETTKEEIQIKQDNTNANTAKLLGIIDRTILLANVLQGWNTEDYIPHIDKMKETGTLTDYIGIGIPPIKLRKTKAVEEIVVAVKNALPQNIKLHGL